MVFFFFHWHYSPLWALACRTMSFHFFLSATNSLQLITPSTWRSHSASSFHPFLGLPLLLVPSSSWVKIFLGILSSSILSRWLNQLILCPFKTDGVTTTNSTNFYLVHSCPQANLFQHSCLRADKTLHEYMWHKDKLNTWKEQKGNPILARTVTILGLMVVNISHQEGVLEGFSEQRRKYQRKSCCRLTWNERVPSVILWHMASFTAQLTKCNQQSMMTSSKIMALAKVNVKQSLYRPITGPDGSRRLRLPDF